MWLRSKPDLPTAETAMPGRSTPLPVPERHEVLGTAMTPPWPTGSEVLYVAMGCFWGAERFFWQIPGVITTAAGYTGGFTPNPTYEETCTGRTGHTEAVLVVYDPAQADLETLLKAFWENHDPTQLNGQGPDAGPEYRSAAFYRTPEERKSLEATIAKVNTSKVYGAKVVTEVVPFRKFWPAEDYHQGYYRLHPENPYIGNVSARKVEHVRKAFASDLKSPL